MEKLAEDTGVDLDAVEDGCCAHRDEEGDFDCGKAKRLHRK